MGGWAEFLQDMNNYYGVEMDCLSREFREEQQVTQVTLEQDLLVTSSLVCYVQKGSGGRSRSVICIMGRALPWLLCDAFGVFDRERSRMCRHSLVRCEHA